MKKERLLLLSLFVFTMSWVQAQDNTYLQEIAKVVKELRKSNESTYRSAIATLSAAQKPKITLMDEARWAGDEEEKANEVKGAKGNRFKLNRIVASVYKKQNHLLESNDKMLNGNERDIHYSIIEKSVKRGGQISYRIRGRKGDQDFMFIPFNPKTKYVVKMYAGGQEIEKRESQDVCQIHLSRLTAKRTVAFSINYPDDKANKDQVESFAILNYNPQK